MLERKRRAARVPIRTWPALVVRNLQGLAVSGPGTIEGQGRIRAQSLRLTVDGFGAVVLAVEAESLRSRIPGSGEIRLEGRAAEHDIEICGSGRVAGAGILRQR